MTCDACVYYLDARAYHLRRLCLLLVMRVMRVLRVMLTLHCHLPWWAAYLSRCRAHLPCFQLTCLLVVPTRDVLLLFDKCGQTTNE